jgi:L-iditol 2-dehydrogenase
VFGAGPIGLLCAAVAKAFGASTILVVDINKSRLAFAKEYAATDTYQMQSGSPVDNAATMLSSFDIEGGADVVIEATGAESCISCGIWLMKRGGAFVQAGLGQSTIAFPVGEICSKEGSFKGSFRYGPGDYETAVGLLSTGRVEVESLVTHKYAFEEAEDAFKAVSQQVGIKSIIYGPGVDAQKTNL